MPLPSAFDRKACPSTPTFVEAIRERSAVCHAFQRLAVESKHKSPFALVVQPAPARTLNSVAAVKSHELPLAENVPAFVLSEAVSALNAVEAVEEAVSEKVEPLNEHAMFVEQFKITRPAGRVAKIVFWLRNWRMTPLGGGGAKASAATL